MSIEEVPARVYRPLAALAATLEIAGCRLKRADSVRMDIVRHIAVASLLLATNLTMATHVEAQECSGEGVTSSWQYELARHALTEVLMEYRVVSGSPRIIVARAVTDCDLRTLAIPVGGCYEPLPSPPPWTRSGGVIASGPYATPRTVHPLTLVILEGDFLSPSGDRPQHILICL